MRFVVEGPREDLCLAFANTLSWRGQKVPAESLAEFADLLAWLVAYAGWPAAAITAMRSAPPPGDLFAAAIELRELLFAIFSAIADGKGVADGDLAPLDRALTAAPARMHLARREAGFGWPVDVEVGRLSAPLLLAPVLWSAADLAVAATRHGRVRRCANDECLWLFVDQSKSGSRRWCDMAACGNRAKARRHYARRRLREPADRG